MYIGRLVSLPQVTLWRGYVLLDTESIEHVVFALDVSSLQ